VNQQKDVFSRRLKVPSVSDAVSLHGKLFQARGSATKKARPPVIERRDDGVTRADVDAERSRLPAMSATRNDER